MVNNMSVCFKWILSSEGQNYIFYDLSKWGKTRLKGGLNYQSEILLLFFNDKNKTLKCTSNSKAIFPLFWCLWNETRPGSHQS